VEVIQFIHIYSDKWTKIAVKVGMCLGNNEENFQLHRFTTGENIATVFFGGGLHFLTHTVLIHRCQHHGC